MTAQQGDVRRKGAKAGHRVGVFLAHVVWSTKVTGQEHVPQTGPVILAANHSSAVSYTHLRAHETF